MVHLNSPGPLSATRKKKKEKEKEKPTQDKKRLQEAGSIYSGLVFKGHSIRIHQAQALFSGSSWWDWPVALWVPMISQDHDATSLLRTKTQVSPIPSFHTSWWKTGRGKKVTGSQEQTADRKQRVFGMDKKATAGKSSWWSWLRKMWSSVGSSNSAMYHICFYICSFPKFRPPAGFNRWF